jgi:hypothetical protein
LARNFLLVRIEHGIQILGRFLDFFQRCKPVLKAVGQARELPWCRVGSVSCRRFLLIKQLAVGI